MLRLLQENNANSSYRKQGFYDIFFDDNHSESASLPDKGDFDNHGAEIDAEHPEKP